MTDVQLVPEQFDLKNMNFQDFVKFAMLQCLKAPLQSLEIFVLSVENLESVMIDKLPSSWEDTVSKKRSELESLYRSHSEEGKAKINAELTKFKFRELVKLMKGSIPEEVEGTL